MSKQIQVKSVGISISLYECQLPYRTVHQTTSKTFEGTKDDGSDEHLLAYYAHYWSSLTPKFGNELKQLRVSKYLGVGELLFSLEDICTLMRYEGSLENFIAEELGIEHTCNNVYKLFMEYDDMLLVIMRSEAPSVLQYRNHIIKLYKGRVPSYLEYDEYPETTWKLNQKLNISSV